MEEEEGKTAVVSLGFIKGIKGGVGKYKGPRRPAPLKMEKDRLTETP
jgi:hypothetical protein